MTGFALHPEAFADLEEIREYIAVDNPDAVDRVIAEIFEGIRELVSFPSKAIAALASHRAHCGLS
jgi:plasmid stabilization system protein ParE